jgi:hypothetical protein
VADKEYYSFEEVLQDLSLEESELKRLVSAGEIRAFRDKNTMRFKAEDVARLKTTRPEDDLGLDDLELDLDDAAPATARVERETTEELVLEDAPVAEGDVVELDLAAEAAGTAARGRAVRESAAPARRSTRVAAAEVPEGKDSPLVVVCLVAGVLLLVVANFVVFDAVSGSGSNPLSDMVANMFG